MVQGNGDDEKRGYFRIHDTLRLSVELLSLEQIADRRRFIQQRQLTPPSEHLRGNKVSRFSARDFADPQLAFLIEQMAEINRKLDFLLDREAAREAEDNLIGPVQVDMSASGMKFAWRERFELESYLHLVFALNLNPALRIDTLAKVVRVENNTEPENWGPAPHLIAVQFEDLKEPVLETLVRYVFSVQRGQLRQEKRKS